MTELYQQNRSQLEGVPNDQLWVVISINVGNLISGSSAFSKSSLNSWKFLVAPWKKSYDQPRQAY